MLSKKSFTVLRNTVLLFCMTVDCFPLYYDKEDHALMRSDRHDNFMMSQNELSMETLEPKEIQNAMCSIVTDQIKATANATITRQLRGVCHAREVREQLRHIELGIIKEVHKVLRAVQTIAANNQEGRQSVIFKYLPNRP